MLIETWIDVPSQDGSAGRRNSPSGCSVAVNPAGLSAGQRAADVLDVRRVSEWGDGTASDRPVLLLPRQRVWEGGTSAHRLSHLLLRRPRPTNRLLLCVQLRSDRQGRFTYANDMQMTQTRGHADRFHFSSWAKSQSRASFGHSTGILPHYIIRTMMPDLWHVRKLS